MPYYKKIVGDRIYLSPKELNDEAVEKYTEWMNDFRVTDYLGGSGNLHRVRLGEYIRNKGVE